MRKLEVIVTSAAEARVAAAAGADRLELVRDLNTGGLTPEWEVTCEVAAAVSIPVRVMLRENASMAVADAAELKALQTKAAQIQALPIGGLVMGWVTSDGAVDVASLAAVLAYAGKCPVTFHRAFEHLADPFAGLLALKSFPQIDKILTNGGAGSWLERKQRLRAWSDAAAPEIRILVGGGLSNTEIADLMADPQFPEVHVGRAARTPQENDGVLDAQKIALLKTTRRVA
jgi:copper homeostasis protein